MADNMIELVASINEDESLKKIQGQLNKIAPSLNLEIKGSLSSETIDTIRGQLKNLNVSIGGLTFDNSNITSVVSSVQNSLSNVNAGINIPVKIDESSVDFLNNTLENLGANKDRIKNLTDTIKELDIVVTKIKPKFVELAGSGGDKVLDTISISGIDKKTGNIVNIINQTDELEGKVAKTTYSVTQNLAEIQKANKKVEDSAKAAQLAYNDFLKLKGQADVYSKQYSGNDSLRTQLEDIQKLVGSFDKTQPIEKQRETIILIDNELKKLKVDIDGINKAAQSTVKSVNDIYINIPKGTNTQETISNAKNTLNAQFEKIAGLEGDKASRVKRAIEDTTGELQRFYIQIEKGDKSVETLTYALDKQANEYVYLGKTIREADNSTDFRSKDITTQWDIQTQRLQQFIANAEKAGAASTVLAEDIKNLKTKLDAKGDNTSAMNAFLDDFDIAKAKLQAFNSEIRKENATTNFSNRVKRLTADMNAYASANQRAVESIKKMTTGQSFANEWSRLTNLMAQGADLSDIEIKQLTADIAVFKKEAKAAGLEGASAFEKFGKSFQVISTYISANQIINRAISKIREAITELKSINDILTEINKTSDRTAASLRKLGDTSFSIASEYGRAASDYLLGVQEMSRAGFSELQSEALAKLSLQAQAAGDMTAEMANEYLIATNAAYKLEGNEKELNTVLDAQNYITNRNAVNMENLAQATKVAASQASASGVAVDELTAAVGTMVATTQQGGDVAGRAFKGILMNLQQVKATAADIGDGGEDITDESLSKYEKATKALGVSLKEVKNGTLQLREPMEILRDLAEAVSKESEGSVKVANLISSVGGKFRGNQLIALLQNWDTYEKMLSEFNSEEAVGSAMREAEKSATNWAGSINRLKNSWAEFIDKFINSENAINVVNSFNSIIQSLTSSSVSNNLGKIASFITDLIKLIGNLTEKIGVIPTVLGIIATFKGENIKSLVNSFLNLITAEEKAAATARSLGVALRDVALNIGLFWAISKVIGLFTKLKEEADELAERQKQAQQTIIDNYNAYKQEEESVNSLVQQYVNLATSTDNLSSEQKSLLDIQEQLNKSTGEHTEQVDLLNKSIKENIELLQQQKLEEAENTIRSTQGQAELARKGLSAVYEAAYTDGRKDIVEAYDAAAQATGKIVKGTLEEQSSQLKEMIDEYGKLESHNAQYYNLLIEQKEIIDKQVSDMKTVVAAYEEAQRVVQELKIPTEKQEQFNALLEDATEKMKAFNASNNAITKYGISEELESVHTQLIKLAGDNTELMKTVNTVWDSFNSSVNDATYNTENLRDAFYESLDEMQKGAFKNVENITKAMQTLAEGDMLSNSDFWDIEKLDTNKLLSNIETINGEWSVDLASLQALKDEYIQDQIDIIEASNQAIADEHADELAELESYKNDLLSIQKEIADSNIDITQTVFGNIDTNSRQLLEWTNANLNKYSDAIESWGMTAEELAGSVSTVLGMSNEYDGVEIAFSPMLQTESGAVLLTSQTVDKYIWGLIEKAGEGWTSEDLLKLDTTGLEIDGQKIKGLIADIGETAIKTGEAMHYVGKNGALATAQRDFEKVNNNARSFTDIMEKNNLLVKYLNNYLGNTVDITAALEKQVKKAQEYADNLLKAQEYKIDQIINGHEAEKETLEAEKEILEDELDILEQQQAELEEIISNYESVNKLVQDTIEKEIDALEEQKKAIEDTYNKRIDALKAENEERSDALEYAQKLANLENAKNNKVRVIDETRGFRYESKKEDVVKAETELKNFENEQSIKELENQRDKETAAIDDIIESKQKYSDQWSEILDLIKTEEDELLAEEILGADWREKIASGDMEIMDTFRTAYLQHNGALKNITNTEIKLKKAAIEAKDAEIKSKQQQIDTWKKYKTTVQDAAKLIKDSTEEYMKLIPQVEGLETGSLQARETNLYNFKIAYEDALNTAIEKQKELDGLNKDFSFDVSVYGLDELQQAVDKVKELGIEYNATAIGKYLFENADKLSKDDAYDLLYGYADASSNNQGARRYGAPNTASLYKTLSESPLTTTSTVTRKGAPNVSALQPTTNTSNVTVNIDKIVTDSPADFAKQLDQYCRTKLTANYTRS